MIIESKPITRIIIINFLPLRAMCPLPCQHPLDPHGIFAEWGARAVGADDPAAFRCNHMQYVLITASLWPRGHLLVLPKTRNPDLNYRSGPKAAWPEDGSHYEWPIHFAEVRAMPNSNEAKLFCSYSVI